MTTRTTTPHELDDTEEIGALAMGDLMAAMLFIVIISLVAYVITFRGILLGGNEYAKQSYQMRELRVDLLYEIQQKLSARGIRSDIDDEKQLVRLNNSVLSFKSGGMIPENSETIEILSDVLNEVLPCAGSTPPERCNSKYPGAVDAVMIEGHTDSTGSALANLELSQRRAFETYSMITSASRTLADIHNSRGETILGSGGYGEERPLPNTERDSSLNRRVEIRLIMRQPKLVGDAQITR